MQDDTSLTAESQWEHLCTSRLAPKTGGATNDDPPACILIAGRNRRWLKALSSLLEEHFAGTALPLMLEELAVLHPDFDFYFETDPDRLTTEVAGTTCDLALRLASVAVTIRRPVIVGLPVGPLAPLIALLQEAARTGYHLTLLVDEDPYAPVESTNWTWSDGGGLVPIPDPASSRTLIETLRPALSAYLFSTDGTIRPIVSTATIAPPASAPTARFAVPTAPETPKTAPATPAPASATPAQPIAVSDEIYLRRAKMLADLRDLVKS